MCCGYQESQPARSTHAVTATRRTLTEEFQAELMSPDHYSNALLAREEGGASSGIISVFAGCSLPSVKSALRRSDAIARRGAARPVHISHCERAPLTQVNTILAQASVYGCRSYFWEMQAEIGAFHWHHRGLCDSPRRWPISSSARLWKAQRTLDHARPFPRPHRRTLLFGYAGRLERRLRVLSVPFQRRGPLDKRLPRKTLTSHR